MEKQKNIPELRFPEYEGYWEKKKLGELIKRKQSGVSRKLSDADIGYPIIRSNNIHNGKLNVLEVKYWHLIDDQGVNLKSYILEEGDILVNFINSVAQIGKAALYEDLLNRDTIFTTNILRLSVIKNIDTRFIFCYFNTNRYNNYIQSIAKPAVNQASFTTKEFQDYPLATPTLPEQQKIASFFTAIDKKISQLKQKKTLLEQYKKGVMQKIFSQEIRFRDENGQEFPKWEKKRLGELSVRMTGKNSEGNENVLTISAQYGLVSQLDFFNKSVAAKDLSGYYLLRKDDFAYNKSYSAGYPMGAIKRLKYYDTGVVSTLYICFTFNKEVNLSFMEQYFESGKHNREIEKVAQEGARNHGLLNIGVNDFFSTELFIPSLLEQTKIANFFSAIDAKINHAQTQIENAERWKKGLLQKMFL